MSFLSQPHDLDVLTVAGGSCGVVDEAATHVFGQVYLFNSLREWC
jgi:hypothetical protein